MTSSLVGAVVRVDAERLRAFVTNVLLDLGFSAVDADVAADVMVTTELRGVATHGTYHLQSLYLPQIEEGGINVHARPHIARETQGAAVLEGEGGLGQVAAMRATEIAAEKARDIGCATVVVRNTNHCGALGHYALVLARQGFIGIAAQNSLPGIAPPGATAKVIGNQPTAYGLPDPDGKGPIVLDIALSVAAHSKVHQRREQGEPIPDGWIIDGSGLPTTDPTKPYALAPIAGLKGYGLAVLIEVMTGVLAGGAILSEMNLDMATPMGVSFWVTAFDVEAFMPLRTFKERLAHLRAEIHAAPTMPGVDRLRLPGEPEAVFEADARENGIPLSAVNWKPLLRLAAKLGRVDELEQALVGRGST